MFAHARNRHEEHIREVWSSSARASSRRSAWVKSPRKLRGGRFTTTIFIIFIIFTRKAVGVVAKGKRRKKTGFSSREDRIKAFPVKPYPLCFDIQKYRP